MDQFHAARMLSAVTALPRPERSLWTRDFQKRWHKAVCQINVYSIKMTASLVFNRVCFLKWTLCGIFERL